MRKPNVTGRIPMLRTRVGNPTRRGLGLADGAGGLGASPTGVVALALSSIYERRIFESKRPVSRMKR